MRVFSSVSLEHDTKPVLTRRETFDTEDFASACKTALFRAEKEFPKAKARSIVVCIEKIEVPKPDTVPA